ncbi:hypothetical protein BGZ95_010131, partial [Linnemannia exigua]
MTANRRVSTSAGRTSTAAAHPFIGPTTRSRSAARAKYAGTPTVMTTTNNSPHQEKLTQLQVLLAHKSGETITIPCADSDTITEVLLRIRTFLGIHPVELVQDDLFINGHRLWEKTRTVAYHRIFGRVFTYRPVFKHDKSLFVQLSDGRVFGLELTSLDLPVSEFMEMIWEKEGIHMSEQRLMHKTNQMSEFQRTLKEYDVELGSTIYMMYGVKFNQSRISFDNAVGLPGLPKGEVVHLGRDPGFYSQGAYIECRCDCTPSKSVFCYKKIGTFDLADPGNVACPKCGQGKVVPMSVGFVECKYRIFAIRQDYGEQFTSTWKKAEGNRYKVLDVGKSVKWRK